VVNLMLCLLVVFVVGWFAVIVLMVITVFAVIVRLGNNRVLLM